MLYLTDESVQGPPLFLNVYTAEEEPEPPWTLEEGPDLDEVTTALPFGLQFGSPTGWPDGPGAVGVGIEGWWWNFELGARILVWDGVELAPLDECIPESEAISLLFRADDQIWEFTAADGTYSWSPLWR